MMFNTYWERLEFEIPTVPELSGCDWMRWIDTSLESPVDICSWEEAEAVREIRYGVQPRSVVVLAGRVENEVNLQARFSGTDQKREEAFW